MDTPTEGDDKLYRIGCCGGWANSNPRPWDESLQRSYDRLKETGHDVKVEVFARVAVQ